MKKKMYVLGVAALVAALLAMSGVAQSAMWVGAELGGNFASGSANTNLFGIDISADLGFKPSVIGGAIIGYDFVNSGFGAYAWPDWMKYFSFAMDITYNRLTASQGSGIFQGLSLNSRMDGYEFAWTFLFMAHYGFLPDSEVPGGRINPYIGVGPAIVWTGIDYKVPTNRAFRGDSGADAMNVALVVEPGIRWMCFKNVSIDTAMRYRYSQPSWSENNVTIKANPLHQLAFLLRANYHF
ncbi:MAG: hypothetical protein COS90_10055 [Deltaproteobacteria bacterium CG07_land_8_20_14_0_80_60_11]|nr:MAG: hypothetical protein COS90_10055 [Deltaproteobacteria bacterium CG07_land_8_20_14_0_80_60_11]